MPHNWMVSVNTALKARSRDGVFIFAFDKLVILAMTLFLLAFSEHFLHATAALRWGWFLVISFGFGHLVVNAVSIFSAAFAAEPTSVARTSPLSAE